MCLVVVLHRVHPDLPLVVAANRDERLDRPAVGLGLLQPAAPRILGGRDLLAGGTWLATNEHGVVAALTNLPAAGRDPARRSRGELPLRLARQPTAAQAAAALAVDAHPADYNPAWLLVADRDTAWYLDWTGAAPAVPRRLDPGVHVLENSPLDVPTPKSRAVHAAVAPLVALPAAALGPALLALLGAHQPPPDAPTGPRPPETLANCVHFGPYGTRGATVVRVAPTGLPTVDWTDGPPCVTAATRATWPDPRS